MNKKGESNKKRINDLQWKIQQQLQGAVVTDTTTTTTTKARNQSGSVGAAGSAATTRTTRTTTRMNQVLITFKKGQFEGVYTGPLSVDRKPQGVGTIRFTNGDTYSGEMEQGKMSGRGTLYTKTTRGVQPVFANNTFMAIPSLLVLPPATTAVVVVPQTAAVSPTTTTTTSSSNINTRDHDSTNKEDHGAVDSNNKEDHVDM